MEVDGTFKKQGLQEVRSLCVPGGSEVTVCALEWGNSNLGSLFFSLPGHDDVRSFILLFNPHHHIQSHCRPRETGQMTMDQTSETLS
jgi:hypothetical protein